MSVVNVMEEIVAAEIDKQIESTDCCRCQQCVDDIKAIALNNINQKYVSTDKGRLYSKMESIMSKQKELDVQIAVMNAIEFVNEHPRHDKGFGEKGTNRNNQ